MDSQVLDVAIGLIFIFTLYSLLVTILNEIIATVFKIRARVLAKAMQRMLEDEKADYWKHLKFRVYRYIRSFRRALSYVITADWMKPREDHSFYDEFYAHPTIKYLGENRMSRRPSYIGSGTFSKTLIDLLHKKGAALNSDKVSGSGPSLDVIRTALANIGDISVQVRQEAISKIGELNNDLAQLKASLERSGEIRLALESGNPDTDTRKRLSGLLEEIYRDVENLSISPGRIVPVRKMLESAGRIGPKIKTHLFSLLNESESTFKNLDEAVKKWTDIRTAISSDTDLGEEQRKSLVKLVDDVNQVMEASLEKASKIHAVLNNAGNISDETREHLLMLVDEAGDNLEKFKLSLEQWFDEMMMRASGWYKRKTKFATFFLGFVVALAFNVNTIEIVKRLNADKDAASKLADLATKYAEVNKDNARFIAQPVSTAAPERPDSLMQPSRMDSIDSVNVVRINMLLNQADSLVRGDIQGANSIISIGWGFDTMPLEKICRAEHDSIRRANGDTTKYTGSVSFCIACKEAGMIWERTKGDGWLGYLITALAISLGAPFWFDLLSKLVKLRGSGDDPDKKKEAKVEVETKVKATTSAGTGAVSSRTGGQDPDV